MLHLPQLADDETLYSLISRIALFNGEADHLKLLKGILNDSQMSSILGRSPGLDHFTQGTRGLYGDAQEFSRQTTSFNIFAHLGHSSPLLRYEATKGLWFWGGCVDATNNSSRELRFCDQCFIEDMDERGFSHWRRVHQLLTSEICLQHMEPLKAIRLPAKRLNDHVWMVEELLQEAKPLRQTYELDKSIAMTQLGKSILNDHTSPFSYLTLRSVLIEELSLRGYVTNNGKFRERVFNEYISRKSDSTLRTSRFLREASTIISSSHNPLVLPWTFMVLIERLFGDWELFKKRCTWVEVMANGTTCDLIQTNAEIRDKNRAICLDYINSNAQPGRDRFLKYHYKSFRWLLHHDCRWLDSHLPVKPIAQEQLELFPA